MRICRINNKSEYAEYRRSESETYLETLIVEELITNLGMCNIMLRMLWRWHIVYKENRVNVYGTNIVLLMVFIHCLHYQAHAPVCTVKETQQYVVPTVTL